MFSLLNELSDYMEWTEDIWEFAPSIKVGR
jgi:hypothetical protein